jgi:hypothetical protein
MKSMVRTPKWRMQKKADKLPFLTFATESLGIELNKFGTKENRDVSAWLILQNQRY